MLSGVLCVLCFCLLSAKAATARSHLKNLDTMLMKLHKPVSAVLIIACFVHILSVIPILKSRHVFVMIPGISNVVLMVLLICLCHVIKDKIKKMLWHRRLTIFMAISIAAHVAVYHGF